MWRLLEGEQEEEPLALTLDSLSAAAARQLTGEPLVQPVKFSAGDDLTSPFILFPEGMSGEKRIVFFKCYR